MRVVIYCGPSDFREDAEKLQELILDTLAPVDDVRIEGEAR